MIDWFSGYVGYDASCLTLGRISKVNRFGVIEIDRPTWESAEGSWSSTVQVTCAPATPDMLEAQRKTPYYLSPSSLVLKVSGNPVKYLQGHNAAGPSVSHLGPVVQAMVRALPKDLRPVDASVPMLPVVQRSRVDVTTAVDLHSHDAVHEWLLLAEKKTRSRHGRAVNDQGTVYWGKNSTRWSLKAYCKHCEMKKHPPPAAELIPDLLEWTRSHLRIELTLRRPELKVRGQLAEAVIWEFFSKLEVQSMAVKQHAAESLPPFMRLSLEAWYDGKDLKSILAHNTFYRYRRRILADTGIDVALPYVQQDPSAAPVLLGLEDLRAREVRDIPAKIQRSLFGAGV